MAGHDIYSVWQTVWYHSHKLARSRLWGKSWRWEKTIVESERVKKKRKCSQCLLAYKPLLPTGILSMFHHCPFAYTQTSTEGAWITSWCNFLNFHLESRWETAWLLMGDGQHIKYVWNRCLHVWCHIYRARTWILATTEIRPLKTELITVL